MIFLAQIINSVDNILWKYFGIIFILFIGTYFTLRFKFGQITKFYFICKNFLKSFKHDNKHGIHPIKTFFISIGGCIGIGNVIATCTAIKIGGPGSLFWIWIAAFLGMPFKYSEVYLGMKYRRKNSYGSYNGGPMYFLQLAFKNPIFPILSAILLAVYGTEVYMFNTLTETLMDYCNFPKWISIGVLLIAVIGAGIGGTNKVSAICSIIMPLFLLIFMTMCSWILLKNASQIPKIITMIFSSAFSEHAPLGGFIGSSIMLTASQGIARGCYTGDIGVGFASVLHAESSSTNFKKQSSLAIFGIFLDTFLVCTMSVLIILITDVWKQDIPASKMVHIALETQFSNMEFFMPIFIILLGYSSMISFYCVGEKCVKFLFPKNGIIIYFVYTIINFLIFSRFKSDTALSVMSISGALLLIINSIGIFKLRKEIKFI